MALAKKKKKTAKPKLFRELTIWDCLISYPVLATPKPFKGKSYYSCDGLLEKDDPQCKEIRMAIKSLAREAFGDDETEWPEKIHRLQDGDEVQDSKGYKGRRFFKASTQSAVPVVNLAGKEFSPASVKGGMYANIAIRIAVWENEGEQGISIYLQGVQVDTKKKGENFGGGKSAEQMFKRDADEDDTDDGEEEDSEEDDSDDEDEEPVKKKKKKHHPVDEDDEEDSDEEESDDEDEEPIKKKKKKRPPVDEDDED